MVLLLVELVFYLLNIEMFVTSSKKMDCMSLFRQVNTGVYWYEKPIAVLWSWVKFPVAALWCLDDPKIPFWASVACSAALCFVLGVTRRWYARFL